MVMRLRLRLELLLSLGLLFAAPGLHADSAAPFDAAAAFGARPTISSLRMSPDGSTVAFMAPIKGQGSALYTMSLEPGAKPKAALVLDGKPFRLGGCNWVANDRLICDIHALLPDPLNTHGLLPVNRLVAVNADGSNMKQVSTETNENSRAYLLSGGTVVDWLPDQDGMILMARVYVPDTHGGSRTGSDAEGVGVDLIDTRTLAIKHVVSPERDNSRYISDGRGNVRILGIRRRAPNGLDTGELIFMYRRQGSTDWHELSRYDDSTRDGFTPIAVDHDLNIAYGWKQLNGRRALYSMSLDESPHETLVYARPDVDLSGLVRIGRRNRVVGVTYATDMPHREVFEAGFNDMMAALHRALPKLPLMGIIDSSVDENKMLLFAGSDNEPGTYFIYDRKANSIRAFLEVRPPLHDRTLARVKPISYPGADGVMIPGYLTLPPGSADAQGLPAIVMPHGGPSERDDWGFDYLAQFFAARGYAVLQPNYRGSSGYGDDWFEHNGFKSWNIAVGDVVAAGRWLVSSGIADPAKLGIVGWSYGGYAALQSVDIDANVFKAIVAIAPVTDLAALKEERRGFSDFRLVSDFIGGGTQMTEGSPINHANKFKQPVLIFHGTADRNVNVEESRRMADALKSAHASCELITFEDRDHQLEDSEVRTDMLRRSDAFLRHAFGMSP
ncbi:MAG TPA: S9 family peptidase [Steroidobacteraceae bacterium]|jgi:dipeptidyl aminopeptidase/acylaminoacyl peptidase|nr:S9 family peptidase [Steroidobacteraceae bacterium]